MYKKKRKTEAFSQERKDFYNHLPVTDLDRMFAGDGVPGLLIQDGEIIGMEADRDTGRVVKMAVMVFLILFLLAGSVLISRAEDRELKDTTGQPVFKSDMQTGTTYTLDGSPMSFPRNGAFDRSRALMISGDFSQLAYSIRQDITFKIFDQGVIQDPATGDILYNLMQNDMVALRAVMRLGWEIPNPINAMVPDKTKRCPFAVLTSAVSGASVATYSLDDDPDSNQENGIYTESQLSRMKVDDIKALAAVKGYVITKELKAEIIAEFLEQQNEA